MHKEDYKKFNEIRLRYFLTLLQYRFKNVSTLFAVVLLLGVLTTSLVPELVGLETETVQAEVNLQVGQRKYLPYFLTSKNIQEENGKDGLYITEVIQAGDDYIIRGGILYKGGNGAGMKLYIQSAFSQMGYSGYSPQGTNILTTTVNSDGIWEFRAHKNIWNDLDIFDTARSVARFPKSNDSVGDSWITWVDGSETVQGGQYFGKSAPFYFDGAEQFRSGFIMLADQAINQQSPNGRWFNDIAQLYSAYKAWESGDLPSYRVNTYNGAVNNPVKTVVATFGGPLTQTEKDKIIQAIRDANVANTDFQNFNPIITVDDQGTAKIDFGDKSGIYIDYTQTTTVAAQTTTTVTTVTTKATTIPTTASTTVMTEATTTPTTASTTITPNPTTVLPVSTNTTVEQRVLPKTGTSDNPWLAVAGLVVVTGLISVPRKEKQ